MTLANVIQYSVIYKPANKIFSVLNRQSNQQTSQNNRYYITVLCQYSKIRNVRNPKKIILSLISITLLLKTMI